MDCFQTFKDSEFTDVSDNKERSWGGVREKDHPRAEIINHLSQFSWFSLLPPTPLSLMDICSFVLWDVPQWQVLPEAKKSLYRTAPVPHTTSPNIFLIIQRRSFWVESSRVFLVVSRVQSPDCNSPADQVVLIHFPKMKAYTACKVDNFG